MPPATPSPTPQPAPTTPPDNSANNLTNNPFAQATEAGGIPARTFNSNFDGDSLGVFYRQSLVTGYTTVPQLTGYTQQIVGTTTQSITGPTQSITVPGQTVTQQVTIRGVEGTRPVTVTTPAQTITVPGQTLTTTVPVAGSVPVYTQTVVPIRQTVLLPLATRYSGVEISENDNPRPVDRVAFGYNFYSNAGASLNPGVGGSDVQRQTALFEKTFFGGNTSFGMVLPYVQQYGPDGLGTQTVGDLSLRFKYAFYNDRVTGDLMSAGMVLTVPTGGSGGILADGSAAPHSVLFQPWGGFVKMYDRAYVQGLSSLIIPTDGRDPTVFGNSVGVGYWLYQNASAPLLTGFCPTAEVHVRTPFNDRNPNGLVYLQDQVNLTSGAKFQFGRTVLSASVSVPVVGPRPWAVEGITYLNCRF